MSTSPTGPGGGFQTDPAPTEPFQGHAQAQPQYAGGGQPAYQPGHPYQGQQQQQGSGGSFAQIAKNEFLTRETKPGFLTSEFASSLIVAIAVLIAALVVDGGDAFSAKEAWTLVTALSIGYMISRGLAKSGVRHASKNDDRGI